MNFKALITLTSFLSSLAVANADDLLRFENADQLHGQFEGIAEGPTVLWNRNDIDGGAVKFNASEIRQIILRGGRPKQPLTGLAHIGTANGDRIPGRVRELDGKRLILQTDFGGQIEIPREQIGMVSPNPLGGRVLYHGPFAESEWSMIDAEHPEGIAKADREGKPDESIPLWKFSGSAWYWQNELTGTALARKSGMPDRSILQFQLAWKNRLSMALAFHADFKVPEQVADVADEPKQRRGHTGNLANLPNIFGSSYVLHLYSNYLMLYRTGFDENGSPFFERVQTQNSNLRMGESGKADVELRCNRDSGEIVLFIDGEFAAQWNEPIKGEGYTGKGDGIGFLVQADDSPVRISEMIVAEWNGMPDAARSLQSEDSDIVLLSNGTDRFSGKVLAVEDGKLTLSGRYGDFTFPMDEIAEIRFAKSDVKASSNSETAPLKIRFYPLGRISGVPLASDSTKLRLLTEAAGEIQLNLDSAVMLEFESNQSFIDDWDVEF